VTEQASGHWFTESGEYTPRDSNAVIPAEAVEAAAKALALKSYNREFDAMDDHTQNFLWDEARLALEAAAPYMLADILEDAANTAETDELTTAAEVIYDLRRHAKDLRPMLHNEG
jgi:hypothetical protein